MRTEMISDGQPDPAVVLTKATLRAADALGLRQADLARILGLSRPTVSRMKAGAYRLEPDGKAWELAVALVRLFRSLDAMTAGDEAALRAWMGSENRDLHGVPHELIQSVTGLVETVAYVDGFRARV